MFPEVMQNPMQVYKVIATHVKGKSFSPNIILDAMGSLYAQCSPKGNANDIRKWI